MVDTNDIVGIHDYESFGENFTKKYLEKEDLLKSDAQGRMLYAEGSKYLGQPILITEYGGIAFESKSGENWGYYGAVFRKI